MEFDRAPLEPCAYFKPPEPKTEKSGVKMQTHGDDSMLVAKRGSSARAGEPRTSQTKARQPRSFWTPMRISPSAVG